MSELWFPGRDWHRSPPVVLEVVPPPIRLGKSGLMKRLDMLAHIHAEVGVDGVNIPEIREEDSKSQEGVRKNPFEPRVPPRRLAVLVRERLGVPTIVNRVVVQSPEEEQQAWFHESLEDYGVRDFVLVGGEKSSFPYPGPSVPRATELIRETLGEGVGHVGNICIPSRRRDDLDEPERMEAKARRGADFFSTQIVYHPEEFTRLLADIRSRCDRASRRPILLSLCPLHSRQSISFLRWLGVRIADDLARILTRDADRVFENSMDYLVTMWAQIWSFGQEHGSPPLGINLAPVGPVPVSGTIDLVARLRTVVG